MRIAKRTTYAYCARGGCDILILHLTFGSHLFFVARARLRFIAVFKTARLTPHAPSALPLWSLPPVTFKVNLFNFVTSPKREAASHLQFMIFRGRTPVYPISKRKLVRRHSPPFTISRFRGNRTVRRENRIIAKGASADQGDILAMAGSQFLFNKIHDVPANNGRCEKGGGSSFLEEFPSRILARARQAAVSPGSVTTA